MVRDNVQRIRAEIKERGGKDVGLVAVTKTFGVDAIHIAQQCGCDAVGENYAQELRDKIHGDPQASLLQIPVHFIGAIQTNKVRMIADLVDVWQSVDRESVIAEIAKRSTGTAQVLLQVNTTGEDSKSGCQPSEIDALRDVAERVGIQVIGLMTMGPTDGDPDRTRQSFRLLRQLTSSQALPVCSMGMSGDYLMAVDEGSTMVRIGQALFGPR